MKEGRREWKREEVRCIHACNDSASLLRPRVLGGSRSEKIGADGETAMRKSGITRCIVEDQRRTTERAEGTLEKDGQRRCSRGEGGRSRRHRGQRGSLMTVAPSERPSPESKVSLSLAVCGWYTFYACLCRVHLIGSPTVTVVDTRENKWLRDLTVHRVS